MAEVYDKAGGDGHPTWTWVGSRVGPTDYSIWSGSSTVVSGAAGSVEVRGFCNKKRTDLSKDKFATFAADTIAWGVQSASTPGEVIERMKRITERVENFSFFVAKQGTCWELNYKSNYGA